MWPNNVGLVNTEKLDSCRKLWLLPHEWTVCPGEQCINFIVRALGPDELFAQINRIARTSWNRTQFLCYLNWFNDFLGNDFLKQTDNSYLYLFSTSVCRTRLFLLYTKTAKLKSRFWDLQQRLQYYLFENNSLIFFVQISSSYCRREQIVQLKTMLHKIPKCTFPFNPHSHLPQVTIILICNNINYYSVALKFI